MSPRTHLRRKVVLRADNALVGAEGASKCRIHSVLATQPLFRTQRRVQHAAPYQRTDCFVRFEMRHALWTYYYGLMLVRESQGLDLEEIWFSQKAIDIDT